MTLKGGRGYAVLGLLAGLFVMVTWALEVPPLYFRWVACSPYHVSCPPSPPLCQQCIFCPGIMTVFHIKKDSGRHIYVYQVQELVLLSHKVATIWDPKLAIT